MPKNDLIRGIDISVTAAAFSASGAGSTGLSGMEVHDLDGVWHSGTLPHSSLSGVGADDHHAQSHVLATNSALGADHTISGATSGHVLRASSATAAAFAAIQDADLPSTIVRTSRTITSGSGLTGGGDLSSDRTLAVGAGDGITVNADDVALASTVAGAGLTFTTGVVAVGAGLGITVNADDVALAATVAGAGLTYASGVVAVGAGLGLTVNADDVALTTPGTLTVATTNASTGSHTHAVTSSSNPGAAASILASTGSGGLTLQSLTVAGNVDITSGGDLTVGANILFVDVSQVSVGINGAPDPQFALDVYGPARAEYWIGPHALQIKNALLIAHFDGRQPFETNYSGERNGHMGQVATVAGGAIWREGKFNKAIQIAEATTNLVTNPSFETGTTGWTYNGGSAGSSAAQTALYSHSGTYSVRLSNDTAGENDFYYTNVTGLAASTTYTISAWCYVVSFTAGAQSNLGLYAYDTLDAGATGQSRTITAATDGWVRKYVTVTTTAAVGSHTIQIRLYAPQGYTAWDSVQCEAKAYATPYCDGSLGGFSAVGLADGTGHSWSGTAHASTSSRLVASASYPTSGNLPALKGSVMAWVKLANLSGTAHVLRADGTSAGYIMLRFGTGQLTGYWGTAAVAYATPVSAETWTHVAMTYTGSLLTLYINGQSVASGSSTGFSGMPTLMYVGNTGGTGQINGLIDDLIITSDTKVADEILSIYESNAPVFAETAKYGFRATPKSLVWADDEGLWMRNTSGQAVFGIYGDDSTTKSWAGLTLASGDLVIGDDSRGGYVWWDDSAALLAIGRSGTNRITLTSAGVLAVNDSGGAAVFTFDASAGAEFTKPLTLGTNGGIYQGTGTFSVPTTGLKISNSGGKGLIEGYNTNVVQWYANTDGRLYAGAGEVTLDSGGVKMVAGSSTTPGGGSVRWYASSGDMTGGGAYPSSIHSYITGGINTLYVNAAGGSHTQKVVLRAYTGGAAISSITLTDDGASNAIAVVGATTFNSSTTVEASFTVNDIGNSAYDFRAESFNEANMIFLDSSADLVYLGGSTNGLKVEKGGVVSFIGTGKVKGGTNIPLDTTTGTKLGTATTQKLGFWNATPIVRPSAFTQTYSTASKTHSNLTYSAPATYGAGANGYSTAAMASAVHAAVIALAADVANVKQVLNSVIDDLQSMGLLA